MKIAGITKFDAGYSCESTKKKNSPTQVPADFDSFSFTGPKFTGLMPEGIKKGIKLCVFDLDETLLEGPQTVRDKLFSFIKENKKVLAYSSARPIEKIESLIKNKTLMKPEYCVCNNGANIYKNIDGEFKEINSWSEQLSKTFHKDTVREIVLKEAKKHMFPPQEWEKYSQIPVPKQFKDFTGSKISEYVGFESPLNIRFYIAPTMQEKALPAIKNELKKAGIKTDISIQTYGGEELIPGILEKYFPTKVAQRIRDIAVSRAYPDGSHDALIISAKTDKGMATEFIRKELKIKPREIFASGDAENDFSHTNKGYFFAFLSNATEGLKKMTQGMFSDNIYQTGKPGVEGVYEVIKP